MDDADPGVLAVAQTLEVPLLTPEDDLAAIGAMGIDTAQNVHQCRFAGAVLAANRVDLAFANGQVDVPERLDRTETLLDPAHFQDHAGVCPVYPILGALFCDGDLFRGSLFHGVPRLPDVFDLDGALSRAPSGAFSQNKRLVS